MVKAAALRGCIKVLLLVPSFRELVSSLHPHYCKSRSFQTCASARLLPRSLLLLFSFPSLFLCPSGTLGKCLQKSFPSKNLCRPFQECIILFEKTVIPSILQLVYPVIPRSEWIFQTFIPVNINASLQDKGHTLRSIGYTENFLSGLPRKNVHAANQVCQIFQFLFQSTLLNASLQNHTAVLGSIGYSQSFLSGLSHRGGS